MIQVTNTLTRKKEPLVPLESGRVRMYVCGPTVYNFIHIGNARPLVFFDVVARYLKFSGLQVTRVMNYTDVDDKIIQKAKQEGISSDQITQKYIAEFETDMKLLKVEVPDVQPKVTDHIPDIIHTIERLIKNDLAYVAADGEVFFSVRKFDGYGKLSGKKIDDLLVGARVAPDEKKKDPLDFSLWKPRKEQSEPSWESPWGPGRPGWHIECSAMAMKYLGETFDIHGGGMDLIHPHHENEIAQSEGASHKLFAKYWLHNNLLTVQSEKMSKSLGNVWLVRDFVDRYSAEVLKFFLLSGHYRSTLDFSDRQVKENQAALHRIYSTLEKVESLKSAVVTSQTASSSEENSLQRFGESFDHQWREAMDDDFNTAKLFGLVFDYVRALNAYIDKKGFKVTQQTVAILTKFLASMKEVSGVLNLFGENPTDFLRQLRLLTLKEKGLREEDIIAEMNRRIEARKSKDFKLADEIRSNLASKGIELRDKGQETEWDVTFN
jgi:cysteinyl-tRNA synthetase